MKAAVLRNRRTMQSLRQFYDRIIREPMPDRFAELLKRLGEDG